MGISPAPRTGEIVCGYRLLRDLGSRARPRYVAARTKAPRVAARVVVEIFAESEGLVANARALMLLRHPNLVAVRDVVVEGGVVVVESDFVEGEWLADLIDGGARAAALPLGARLRVLLDVLAGLSALHGARGAPGAVNVEGAARDRLHLVHGEVALTNVLVGADGVARLAHLLRASALPSPDVMGYLAPEVLLHDQSADERADVFSAGVLLWEALAGKRLHETTHAGEIVVRLLGGKVQLAEVPADAPWARPLADVAKRALSPELAARYATALEMATTVRRIAGVKLGATKDVRELVESLAGARIRRRASPSEWSSASSAPVAVLAKAPASEPPSLDEADLVSDDLALESDRPTAIPPVAAPPVVAPKPPRVPRLSLPTPIVPIPVVTAFAGASTTGARETPAPPPASSEISPPAPALVAPPLVESAPVGQATEAPLTLTTALHSETPPPAPRRRGVMLTILAAAALALVLATGWVVRGSGATPPTAAGPSVAPQPEPLGIRRAPPPVGADPPASSESPTLVAMPAPASLPGDASTPSVESADTRPPAAVPAATPAASSEVVAPPPLHKKSKTTYYPLGI